MASLNVCSSKSFPPHPFAFPVVFSLAFAASFLPPVFISILLNFSSYARGKCVLFCNLHFIGCHVFDIRSGHIYFQDQYSAWVFSALFPFCLQCFLSFILCFGCISFQSFPCYSFSAAAPGIWGRDFSLTRESNSLSDYRWVLWLLPLEPRLFPYCPHSTSYLSGCNSLVSSIISFW